MADEHREVAVREQQRAAEVLFELRPENDACNFRILIGPEGRGRGLGTEAAALVVEHAFATTDLHRISLDVQAGNPRARRSYEKVGFVVEGVLRQDTTFDGEHFRVKDQRISLAPVQPGGPPVWIGAGPHKTGAQRGARLGDAWIVPPHVTPEKLAQVLGHYRAERERLGKATSELVVRRELVLDEDVDLELLEWRALPSGFELHLYEGSKRITTGSYAAAFRPGGTVDPHTLDERALDDVTVVARGGADNKGQHLSNILGALDAAKAGRARWRVRVILDGEEEHGSPNLDAIARANRERLAADVLIGSDGPKQKNMPTMVMGVRGLVGVELAADNGRPASLHSGNYGNIVPNPVLPLAKASASSMRLSGAPFSRNR